MELIKDKILYLRLKNKDKEAFIEAYDLYLNDIYRFVYFKVGDKEEAEDLTSCVFLKSWDHIQNNSITDYNTLKALFYKVARNLIIDHYRKKSRQNEVSYSDEQNAIDIADENQDIIKEVELANDIKNVETKIFELKDEYREVLILRYINEMSVNEIANILGKNKGNIRVLIFRALKALREVIEQK